jgi:hypothetical protein
MGQGAASLADGDLDLARGKLLESITYFRSGWQQDWQSRRGMVYSFLSCVDSCDGKLFEAKAHLKEALRQVLAYKSYFGLLHCLAFGALLLSKQGKVDRAAVIYSLVERQPFIQNSIFFETTVGDRIGSHLSMNNQERANEMQPGATSGLWQAGLSLLDCFD